MEKKCSNEDKSKTKEKFILKSKEDDYKFTIYNEEDNITFNLQNTKEFPVKIFEKKTSLKELKENDDCFYGFKTAQKFIINGIKKSIESNKMTVSYSEEDKCVTLEMSHDIFDTDYVAKIIIPEKELDLKDQVESLTKIVSDLKIKISQDEKKEKEKKQNKEDMAINSFIGTFFYKMMKKNY